MNKRVYETEQKMAALRDGQVCGQGAGVGWGQGRASDSVQASPRPGRRAGGVRRGAGGAAAAAC